MRILVVEDDEHTRRFIAKGLRESGHVAEEVDNGVDGLHRARTEEFTALIVDRMLPKLSGLELVRNLRQDNISTPILILSALGDVEQRIEGLKSGSDDYLKKPFSFAELLARIESIVRRVDKSETETRFTVGELSMDLIKREVRMKGEKIDLRPIEFRILEVLMRSSGQLLTRTMLLERVWNYNFDPQTNVVDTHISRLRSKIDIPYRYPLIHTIRGSGYQMNPPVEDS